LIFTIAKKEGEMNQDPETDDVTLSRRPPNWIDFFSALKKAGVPVDFLSANERNQGLQNRDPFEGWSE
jgi:antitoxin VapB